jgi:hypothetical protein
MRKKCGRMRRYKATKIIKEREEEDEIFPYIINNSPLNANRLFILLC